MSESKFACLKKLLILRPAGIVNAISKAMGKEPNVLLYDPAALGLGKSGKAEGFPFRCASRAYQQSC
eukprot:1157357-Pelagomonas_calceolata.AAC.2